MVALGDTHTMFQESDSLKPSLHPFAATKTWSSSHGHVLNICLSCYSVLLRPPQALVWVNSIGVCPHDQVALECNMGSRLGDVVTNSENQQQQYSFNIKSKSLLKTGVFNNGSDMLLYEDFACREIIQSVKSRFA